MNVNQPTSVETHDLAQLRQEGGRWLRARREALGLTQRDLAQAIGLDYYSFVSQIESGRGRVPTNQMEAWAATLKMSRREFAKGVLRYYEPATYAMLFEDEAGQAEAKPEGDTALADLMARLDRLESKLALK